jgi:hypothetical protein
LIILAIWPLDFCLSSPRRSFSLPAYVSFAIARKNHWVIDLANLHNTCSRHYIHDDAQAFHLLYGNTMSHNKAVSAPPPQEQTLNQLVAGLIVAQQVTSNQLGPLTQAMTEMSRTVTMASAARSIVSNVYKPPQPFKGQRGPDVRRFLAAFWVWAVQQPQLQDYEQWIAAAFCYLHDNAAIWATPYLEQQKRGETPFEGSWTKFETAFKARFETVDEQYYAREYIKLLKQGSLRVVEYIVKFAKYKDRTGFSPEDLRERLRGGLVGYLKDAMANSEHPTETYKELVETVQILDKCYQERCAEKVRKQGRSSPAAARPYASSVTSPLSGPISALRRDTNTINVNVTKAITKTIQDYNDWMRGKCYGCGLKTHIKADGNHGTNLCGHCGKTRHRADVCQQRFFRHPPSAP